MSATLLAAAQLFGHWTTESAAQVMGEAAQSSEAEGEQGASGQAQTTPTYGAQSDI